MTFSFEMRSGREHNTADKAMWGFQVSVKAQVCAARDATLQQAWGRIDVRAKLQIFATPMSADKLTYENRNSAYLLTWELHKFAAHRVREYGPCAT